MTICTFAEKAAANLTATTFIRETRPIVLFDPLHQELIAP
jgi:hypothetical protein